MKNDIYLIGEVGFEITLESVLEAISKTDSKAPLNVHIHSGGGSVYDGLAIYNHLKNLDREINTISAGLVASIASVIFLAGRKETRKMNKTDSFLIHLPSGMNFGNAEDLEKTAGELRKIENQIASIYEAETNMTHEEALVVMKEDKMLDTDYLKEKGFINEIVEFKAVANFNNKNEIMTKLTKEDKSWFEGMFNTIASKFKPNPVNKIVQDANGVEIDFSELEDDATPAIGDKAQVEGADADGTYILPSGESYVFAAGELSEIIEAEGEGDEGEDGDEELEALKTENADLKKQLEEVQASLLTASTENATNKTDLEEIKNDFTELKNKVTSDFSWTGKEEKGKPKAKTRSFFGKSK